MAQTGPAKHRIEPNSKTVSINVMSRSVYGCMVVLAIHEIAIIKLIPNNGSAQLQIAIPRAYLGRLVPIFE